MLYRQSVAPLFATLSLIFGSLGCGSVQLDYESDRVSTFAEVSNAKIYLFDDHVSGPPANWSKGTTNGGTDAAWEVLADDSAPSAPNALALIDTRGNTGRNYNLCWEPTRSFADVDITVNLRADGGSEDQGGGPAWRLTDAENYYAARWNPLEDNFRVYSIVDGTRKQLDSANVNTDPRAWHTIRVRQVGTMITCWFDGEELLHADDAKLSSPGAVGLWTKADATTRFDDLLITSAN